MPTLRASNLTLNDVSYLLNFEEQIEDIPFSNLLSLESLTEIEKKNLSKLEMTFGPT
jgi:hypothetical protein